MGGVKNVKHDKKHNARASPESPSTVKNFKFEPFGTHPAEALEPADPANQVSGAAARNHPSTRAGGQDDVS